MTHLRLAPCHSFATVSAFNRAPFASVVCGDTGFRAARRELSGSETFHQTFHFNRRTTRRHATAGDANWWKLLINVCDYDGLRSIAKVDVEGSNPFSRSAIV